MAQLLPSAFLKCQILLLMAYNSDEARMTTRQKLDQLNLLMLCLSLGISYIALRMLFFNQYSWFLPNIPFFEAIHLFGRKMYLVLIFHQ